MIRTDHSDWLIHFVRDRGAEERYPYRYDDLAEASESVETMSWPDGGIEGDADAFTVLKTIVRLGGLLSAYSIRSGRTTVYGGQPVVCATEMPIYSLAKYAASTANSRKVSAYGVAFLKSEFFAAGGRPVIYGLSTEDVSYIRNEAFCRVIDPTVLPIAEQYRYVAYNPVPTRWIDWSHEREWRWVARFEHDHSVWCRHDDGSCGPAPGLPLFGRLDEEPFFSAIGILVWNQKEALEIQRLLTDLYFARSNDYDTPFDRSTISQSFIITLEDVTSAVEGDRRINGQTIEGLDAGQLLRPVLIGLWPPDSQTRVAEAIRAAVTAGQQAASEYVSQRPLDAGASGFASVVTYEITNGLVQYMLENGFATGPFSGAAHIQVPHSWPASQSIDYNESVYRAVAVELSAKLGIRTDVTSRLD